MDGKGMAARRSWAYIRMPAARFANTRPRVSALVPTGNQTVFRACVFPFFFLSLAQGIFTFVLNIPCVFHYTILSSIPSVIVERNENSKGRNVSNSIR